LNITETKSVVNFSEYQQTLNSPMYIIKIKGKAKIPDYIQLRDEGFVLVAYFRADRELKNLDRYGLDGKAEALSTIIKNLPFGKLQKLDL